MVWLIFIGVGILGRLGLGLLLGIRLRVLLGRPGRLAGFADLLVWLLVFAGSARLFDCLGMLLRRWLGLCAGRFRILGPVILVDRILCLRLYLMIGLGRSLGDSVGRRCLPRFRICRCSLWGVGLGIGVRPCGLPIGLAGVLHLPRRLGLLLCWLLARMVVLLWRDRFLCSRILGSRRLFLGRRGFRRCCFGKFAPFDPRVRAADYRLRSGGLVLWR